MHAITLSYSLGYAAAVRLGVARSGSDQIDAASVLPLLSSAERAWLAEHPRAVFALDSVVESADDLVGERLAACLAREIRAAVAADDPARLRAAIAAQLVRGLDDARGGDRVAAYTSVPRRVSDGSSIRSGNVGDLLDEDVGPAMMAALHRYTERCLAGLRLPAVMDVDEAPALLRAAFVDGRQRVLDAIVADVERQASASGPLALHVNPLWARKRLAEGSLGVSRSTIGEGWLVADGGGAIVGEPRLGGVIEAAIVAAEERLAATRAAEEAVAAEAVARIEACLDPEQVARRRLGALPEIEEWRAVDADLVGRVRDAVGDDYAVSLVGEEDGDAVDVRWGELPRGGSDVVASLAQLGDVKWGDATSLATGPVVAVEIEDARGADRTLLIERR